MDAELHDQRSPDRRSSMGVRLGRALSLRCPECGRGRLFTGWFTMAKACDHCGLGFAREQGFYIGSIYFNYGATVIATGALYAALVLGLGRSHEAALAACLAAAVCLPILLFRHARSLLLSLDCAVNRSSNVRARPAGSGGPPAAEPPATGGHGEKELSSFRADDASAGYAMGVALVLIILFGLGMAAVTLAFIATGSGPIEQP